MTHYGPNDQMTYGNKNGKQLAYSQRCFASQYLLDTKHKIGNAHTTIPDKRKNDKQVNPVLNSFIPTTNLHH